MGDSISTGEIESPICPKRSQQDNSEPHVLISNGWCEAVGIKDAGSVLSSEKCIVVVIRINPDTCVGKKADALDLAEGSSPVCQNCVDIPEKWVRHVATSAQDTTGV